MQYNWYKGIVFLSFILRWIVKNRYKINLNASLLKLIWNLLKIFNIFNLYFDDILVCQHLLIILLIMINLFYLLCQKL